MEGGRYALPDVQDDRRLGLWLRSSGRADGLVLAIHFSTRITQDIVQRGRQADSTDFCIPQRGMSSGAGASAIDA